MLRTQVRRSVNAAVAYFLAEPALDEEERQGQWIGRGALAAGLRSSRDPAIPAPVLEADLRAALGGIGPWGRPLCQRVGTKRPCAWDIVLTPHKSVSVAALCLPEKGFKKEGEAVKAAFLAARDEAFAVLEDYAARRHNQGPPGARSIPTGSLLAASFVHRTSRHGDPLLHAHLLVMNATPDTLTQRWYGLQSTPYYRLAKSFDVAFQHSLVRHLRAAGFEAEMQTVNRVQVAVLPSVPEIVCTRLSRARQAIVREQNRLLDAGELATGGGGKILRQARLIADRIRPSKAGLLARGKATLAAGISRAEAKRIVGLLPRGTRTTPVVPPPSRRPIRGRGRGGKKRLTQVRAPVPVFVLPPPVVPTVAGEYVRAINEGFSRLAKPVRNFSARLKAAVHAALRYPDAVFRDFLHIALALPAQPAPLAPPFSGAPDLTYRLMGFPSAAAYQASLANAQADLDRVRQRAALPPAADPSLPASPVLVPPSPPDSTPLPTAAVPVVRLPVSVPVERPTPFVRVPTSPVPGERAGSGRVYDLPAVPPLVPTRPPAPEAPPVSCPSAPTPVAEPVVSTPTPEPEPPTLVP